MHRYQHSEAAQTQPRLVVIRMQLRLPPELTSRLGLPDGVTIPLKLVVRVRRHVSTTPFTRLVQTAISPRLPKAWMN